MRLRELKKQESRARVLDAARALFGEIGFEATTVRMIAKRAGVSLGGVFTTFEGKTDILVEIVGERRGAVATEMEKGPFAPDLPTLDRIHAFCTHTMREIFPDHRLAMAYFGAAYGWSEKTERANAALQTRMGAMIGRILQEGMERGELRRDFDQILFLKMVVALNATNFRLSYYGGWTREETEGVLHRQLELLFDGIGPRA